MPSSGSPEMWSRSQVWDAVPYWALHLETSGLRSRSDTIVSVGMIPIRDGVVRYGERYYSLVRPEIVETLSLDGMRAQPSLPAELENAPSLAQVFAELDRRLREAVLLVHFAKRDVAFLRETYRRLGLSWPRPILVDTVELLSRLNDREQRFRPHPAPLRTGLAEARERLALPPHRSHQALDEALAIAELFLALRSRLGARTLRQLC